MLQITDRTKSFLLGAASEPERNSTSLTKIFTSKSVQIRNFIQNIKSDDQKDTMSKPTNLSTKGEIPLYFRAVTQKTPVDYSSLELPQDIATDVRNE